MKRSIYVTLIKWDLIKRKNKRIVTENFLSIKSKTSSIYTVKKSKLPIKKNSEFLSLRKMNGNEKFIMKRQKKGSLK